MPAMAMADPVTLVAVAMTLSNVGWVVATGYALMAANAIYGAADAREKARRAAADSRAAYNAGLQDRCATMLQAAPPWRAVYGQCRVGGDIVAELTSDKFGFDDRGKPRTKADGFKHLVIRIADHQVEAISEVYINGVAVGALDANGFATGGPVDAPWARKRRLVIDAFRVQFSALGTYTVPSATGLSSERITKVLYSSTISPTSDAHGRKVNVLLTINGSTLSGAAPNQWLYISYEIEISESSVGVQKHLGVAGQAADAYLMGVVPTQWTASHWLDGKAYVVLTLDLEDPRFQNGPPQLDFYVLGRLMHDPRTGLTVYSRNNALAIYDWLMAPWGYGCTQGDIDLPAVIDAANVCDVVIPINVGGPVTLFGPAYTCDGLITTSQAKESVLVDMANAMCGTVTYGAQWSMIAGAWTAPVMDLTDDDTAGAIQIVQAAVGLEDAINGMRGTYIFDGAASPTEIEPFSNAAFVAADGVALWGDITLPYTNNKQRAKNISRIRVEQARMGLVVQYPAKMRAWPLKVGERVRVTSAEYGWLQKNFRLTDWAFSLQSAVMLTLQEDEPTVWDLADAAVADPAPNTNIASPWVVVDPVISPPESGTAHLLSLADGTILPRVLVSWAMPTGAHMVGSNASTEVRWSLVGQTDWHVVSMPSDALSVYLTGMVEDDAIVIGVRHINALGIDSAWLHADHIVVGESAPPSDMVGLAIAGTPRNGQFVLGWSHCPDADYAVSELRVGVDWAAGTVIFTGTADTYTWSPIAAGTYVVWGAHRDRTGHESAAPTSITIAVTAADIAAATKWDVSIESVNGTEFRPGQGTQTLLIAHVFQNGVEVTDAVPAANFKWRRVSIVPPAPPHDDAAWNALYATGYKQVLVLVDDVASKATFHCDIFTA